MAISKRLIRQAIESLSEIDGILTDPANLVEDAFLLAFAFPHDNDYLAACASTRRALERLAAREVDASSLKYEFEGWESYFLLAFAFPHDNDYLAACASTRRALERLAAREVDASSLKYEFEGWESYHYQHRVGQGVKATCRIVYRRTPSGIEVKGFGHRRIPADFYERMAAATRRARQRPAR